MSDERQVVPGQGFRYQTKFDGLVYSAVEFHPKTLHGRDILFFCRIWPRFANACAVR